MGVLGGWAEEEEEEVEVPGSSRPPAGHGEEEAGPGAAGPAGPDAGDARPRGGGLAQGAGQEADPGVVPVRLRSRCLLCSAYFLSALLTWLIYF